MCWLGSQALSLLGTVHQTELGHLLMNMQNESFAMGGCEVHGYKTASFCKGMNGREVTG